MAKALSQATIVMSATSSGSCIEQSWLKPGTLAVDVGVPTDIRGSAPERDDVLILTGGLDPRARTDGPSARARCGSNTA